MEAELIDYLGSDLTVVNAARVSFDKESDWDHERFNDKPIGASYPLLLKDGDVKLINYLANHGHWTPFSHCVITLRETIPIFVARQRFKHMVGFTYNEVSRRYVDDTPEFYHPEVWRKKAENKKQGSSDERADLNVYAQEQPMYYATVLKMYKALLDSDVAPEQARMVLPQSMYTSYYVTGSLYAFARAYKLRADPHAQKEIQDLAKEWDRLIRPLYPVSWEALVVNN